MKLTDEGTDVLEQLRSACVLVESPASKGTGYLVSPTQVMTCHHVVESAIPDGPVLLHFPEGTLDGKVGEWDVNTDCAVIELSAPIEKHTPLKIATGSKRRAVWDGYGFPGLIKGSGIPFFGTVLDPAGCDDKARPMLTLYSDMVAAGMAAPINGLSGGPVVVDGAVVGHFSRVIATPGEPGRPALGVVYAARAASVLALLGLQPTLQVVAAANANAPRGLAELVPPIGEDEYHAFLSYRSTDRTFAIQLHQRLEAVGFKVFLDPGEPMPGEVLLAKIERAFARSRSCILLVSHAWVSSPRLLDAAERIAHRVKEEPGFRIISVRLDAEPMPAPLSPQLVVSFDGEQEPSGRKLEAIFYALLGKPVPDEHSDASKLQITLTDATDEMMRLAHKILRDPTRVRDVIKWVESSSLPSAALKLKASQALIDAGRPERALELLPATTDSLRGRQLRALALSKAGRDEEARQILEPMFDRGEIDAETGGILGGIYKRMWQRNKNHEYLIRSAGTYAQTLESDPTNTYVAVNVATTALLLGETESAVREAKRVIGLLNDKKQSKTELGGWDVATLAEALLVSGDVVNAKVWYKKALLRTSNRPANIAVMRRQARLILEQLGHDRQAFDSVLPVPRIVAFSGHMTDDPARANPRFPQTKATAVQQEIKAWLRKLDRSVHLVCSGARGADIACLEAVLELGGTATVYLPFPRDEFKKLSVGQGWDRRFDEALNDARVDERPPLFVTLPTDAEQPAAFQLCNDKIIAEAERLAEAFDDDDVTLLTVWNGKPGGGPGGTSSMVETWRQHRHPHHNINPLTIQREADAQPMPEGE